MNDTRKELGRMLFTERHRHGYTQKQLGEVLGHSHSAYSDIERGLTDVTVKDLAKLANHMGVSLLSLIPQPNHLIGLCPACREPMYNEVAYSTHYLSEHAEVPRLMPAAPPLTQRENKSMSNLPTNQNCPTCGGTGVRDNTAGEGISYSDELPCGACKGTVPIEPKNAPKDVSEAGTNSTASSIPKNPAENEVSEELLSESITSIPPQPAPEPSDDEIVLVPKYQSEVTVKVGKVEKKKPPTMPNQPAPDSPDDELEQILTKFAEVFAMPHRAGKEVMSWWGHDTDLGDCSQEIAEAHAAIESLFAARFEHALGPDDDHTYMERPDRATDPVRTRNRLRAEARTRYYQGDGK